MPKKQETKKKEEKKPAASGEKKAKERKTREQIKAERKANPLFEARPRNFGIGQHIQPPRDLSRYVKWPRYIRLQRQRRVLYQRLKVPPHINQFTRTLDKSSAAALLRLLSKYRPETPKQRKERLRQAAQDAAEGKKVEQEKIPAHLVYGINEVVKAVEQKRAKLVVISHDVNPIELVVYLPTLCRKMNVPYTIIKSKSRLGQVVGFKTCAAIAVQSVRKEDTKELTSFADQAMEHFNKNTEARRAWGGGILGPRSQAAAKKREAAVAKERGAKMRSAV